MAKKINTEWRNRIVSSGTMPASQFVANPSNWRIHPKAQREALNGVLNEVGWVQNVIVNKTTGNVVDGHARIEEALKRGDETPVPYVEVELTADEEQKILLTLDPISAMAAADKANLDALLKSVETQDAAVMAMIADMADKAGLDYGDSKPLVDAEPQTDKAEELRVKWGVETGQLWQLGDHRLLCGDSTKAEDVARVMVDRCDTLIYDPEWDAAPAIEKLSSVIAFTDGQRAGDVVKMFGVPAWIFVWDCVSSWYTPNRPLKRGKMAIWYGDIEKYNFDGSHYGDSGKSREVFNSRGGYNFVPDPRGKHLSDVFSQPITKLHAESEHSHSKPIDWVRMLIGNCTTGAVYDPFSGSGTTLIACEQLGRKCRAIEISPAYVAVALQRWADATGKTPVLMTDENATNATH